MPIALGEQRRDLVVAVKRCSPVDLGGMRGEYELDAQRRGAMNNLRRGHAGGDQPFEAILERAALGKSCGIRAILATAPKPVVLLGDIGQGKEEREGPRQRHGLVDGHFGKRLGQLGDGPRIGGAIQLGQRTDLLHRVEQLGTTLLGEHVAE